MVESTGRSQERLPLEFNERMAPPTTKLDFSDWAKTHWHLSHGAFKSVHDLQVDGFDLWPVLKSTISMSALNQLQNAPFGRWSRPPVVSKVLRVLRSVAKRGRLLPAHELKTDAQILCLANIAPAISIGSTVLNPHIDPLRSAFERRGLRTLGGYYDNRTEVNFAFPSRSFNWDGEAQMLARRYRPEVTRQIGATLARAFHEAAAAGIRIAPDSAAVIQRMSLTLALRDIYARLFGQNPDIRILLLTNYYNPHGWAAISAARNAKILSVDIQHGVQGPFHHAYSWPERSQGTWNILPDLFLSWSRNEQSNLDSFSATGGRSLAIGPSIFQLDQFLTLGVASSSHRHGFAREYVRERDAIYKLAAEERARGRKIAGLFLQYIEDHEWLCALRRHLPADIALWVRRHPGARRFGTVSANRSISDVTVVDSFPLAAIIQCTDVVVTGYSSVGVEAAYVGRPVVAYSPLAANFLETSCKETGYIPTSSDPSTLAGAIAATTARPFLTGAPKTLPALDGIVDKILSRASAIQ